MTEIIALVICLHSPPICGFPTNRMQYFESIEQCRQFVTAANAGSMRDVQSYKCVSKTVPAWKPVD